jgi:beta-lactam-binding protein with PASTA domain
MHGEYNSHGITGLNARIRRDPVQKPRRFSVPSEHDSFENTSNGDKDAMKSAFRLAMLALVLIVVAMLSGLTAMRFAIHGQEVAVPPLVGLTPPEAERATSGLGLQISIERQYYSPQIPEGRIMSQLPLPGTKVRRGWQVRVAQSLGPTRVAVPDVTGQSEHAAELNIRRRGLEIASMGEVETGGIPADQVVAQNPTANATQLVAPKINLLVSSGAEPQAYVMPSFVGQPLGSASRTLQDSGFRLGNVSVASIVEMPADQSGQVAPTAPVQPSPASIIVSQAPAAGLKVTAGSTVSFEVR